ncbi:helix-turn-helix and ligand-binding sensor domain-containing protein [Hyunsoonleella ulvae]|uniref:helix-turn-helix and ligand-binding sensor domain-containing protein n=1 Tax=Hyunsoonleella ulvae TaxID=2799948 RepID=UPI00293D2C04|nr:triple tyrosine motif-containing protein [Hyunsoonleella ulvae]
MKNTYYFFLFLIFGCFIKLAAQERPPINIFTHKDYDAASQNWSISQAENRHIYVANNKGLLEFNGAKWNVYESPNETIIRTVLALDSLIYTGSYHDFGYWKRDNYGQLNYTSLSEALKVEFLEDEEFWNIKALNSSIIFQSLDRIHIYNTKTKSYNTVDFDASITSLFQEGTNFYFQSLEKGLFKIESGKAILVSEDKILKENVVVNVYSHEGYPLILTQDNGFFKLINNQLLPWDIPANDILFNVSVFSSVKLKDKSYALGTISNGIIILTAKGDLKFKIDQTNGLSNNTILSIHEDLDSNIWLGLDNGINCINLNSPYSVYFDKNGVIGSVYISQVHNGMLYLGTNQGLFYKKMRGNDGFKFTKGTQGQVWFLGVIEDTLFCGHNNGTFIINDTIATKIADVKGTWQIKPIAENRSELIQGNYEGLCILHKNNGSWQLKHKIKNFDLSTRYFEFVGKNEIYMSHEYKGLYKLKLNADFTEVLSFSLDTDLKKGIHSSLIKHKNNVLYATRHGVFKYNKAIKKFKKDSLLSKLIDENNFTSAKLVSDSRTNKLWSFSTAGIQYLTSSKLSGEQKIFTLPFPEDVRNDVVGYESVTQISNQKFLLGSTTGYVIIDLNRLTNKAPEVKINQVQVSRLNGNNQKRLADITQELELENKDNNIQFSYSISEYLKTPKPEYRYKLEGIYDNWSNWSTEGSVLFKNLPYGSYTFLLSGRVGNQTTLNNASYTFRIERPWFLSNLAISAYVLGVLLFSLFMHNVYKRYYRKQRERLMQKTTREFELRELENKQQLMRFRNDKLKEDIENKNRELGISTMNLIKKNEFLSSIKQELESVEDSKLNKVIKIIDKNLNNTDDWNLFQEAFNNADKDFLKKIKSIHSNLTSNDLRLCAYLRLNLSSKEIAPLLNISPRSVEVKRYRLRKKMNLPHEASLSDYILEI